MVLFKRGARKGRGIAMGSDAVGSDLEMYDCDKKSLPADLGGCFPKSFLGRFFLTQEKLLPMESGSRFSHPCRQNIIDVCPSYADVFSWWVGFADVTREDASLGI